MSCVDVDEGSGSQPCRRGLLLAGASTRGCILSSFFPQDFFFKLEPEIFVGAYIWIVSSGGSVNIFSRYAYLVNLLIRQKIIIINEKVPYSRSVDILTKVSTCT